MKRHLITAAKILIAIGVLALVFTHVDARAIWQYIRNIPLSMLFLALSLACCGLAMGAVRMRYILKEAGLSLALPFSLKLTYVGAFFNILLPGGVGGDAIKIYFLRKKSEFGVVHLLKLLVADRASGLYFLCIAAFILTLIVQPFNQWPWLEPLLWLGFGVTSASYFLISGKMLGVNVRTCVNATLYSMVVQFFWMATVVVLWIGIGGTSHMVEYVLLYAIAGIISTVPLSIGGLGLREGAFLYGARFLHNHAGLAVDEELGVALSLALYGVLVLSALPGVIFLKQVKEHKGLDEKSPLIQVTSYSDSASNS